MLFKHIYWVQVICYIYTQNTVIHIWYSSNIGLDQNLYSQPSYQAYVYIVTNTVNVISMGKTKRGLIGFGEYTRVALANLEMCQ